MVAHTKPVISWGLRPCGEFSPTTTCVSGAGGRAPRPPGTGRGKPEVQTLRNSALKLAYGRRQIFAGVAKRRAPNEQRPLYAAAPTAETIALAYFNASNYRDWSGGVIRKRIYSSRMMVTSGQPPL